MSAEEHYRKLERMYAGSPANAHIGAAIMVTEGAAEVTLEIREDFHHTAGAVHGSFLFKLLDDSSFFSVASLVKDRFVVTVSYHIHLLRPVSEGILTARGRVVHRARKLFVAESTLVDERGREVARGSGTFVPSQIELGPEVGYA